MNAYYMNGAGNDFMVMDIRGLTLDLQPPAVRLCKLSGADGFLALDTSDMADFRLHFYNADGLRGEMCGNGARCVCRFAYDHGITGEYMVVQTDAGLVTGQRLDECNYRIELNTPSVLDLHRKDDIAYVELGDPGIPHAVVEVPSLRWEDRDALRKRAKALRYDPVFPKGVNVNFYTWLDAHTIRILTYERGVEDYTLACGTGSGSTAVVLWHKGMVSSGNLTVENPGGILTVTVSGSNGKITALTLDGPTEFIRTYTI